MNVGKLNIKLKLIIICLLYSSKDFACLLTLKRLDELRVLSPALHIRGLRYKEVE